MLDTVPKGFRVRREPTGEIWIDYHPPGVGGPARFFILWFVFTSVGCIGSVYDIYGRYDDLALFARYLMRVPWLGWLVVTIVAVIMMVLPAIVLMWFLFGRNCFGLSEDGLWIQKRLFFWQRIKFVPLEDMQNVRQVKDGGQVVAGQVEDSFSTWGLKIYAEKETNLLWRQPIEMSDWLGGVLSNWYDIPFVPSDERE